MSNFFLILMGFFIVIANVIGFMYYKEKEKSILFGIYNIIISSFGTGGVLALLVIRDPFAIFYGLQVGYYLLINCFIVFLIAILATIIKRYNNRTT